MEFKTLVVYYFSGTGNARHTAQWMAETAENNGVRTHLINLDRVKKADIPECSGKTLLVFCYPTHGFNAPPIILNLLVSFPKRKNTHVFFVNTRAGMRMGNFNTRGLSGVALLLPAFIMFLKGYRIQGFRSVDLPSNWIPVHPGIRPKVVNSMVEYWKEKVPAFTTKLLSGKKIWIGLLDLPQDILISPVSVGYYFFGRFYLAKTYIATKKCNSCGLCIKSCPVNALKEIDGRPFWTHKCESCMRCMNLCPQRAIETPHAFVGIMIYVLGYVITPALINFLITNNWLPFKGSMLESSVVFLLGSLVSFPALFASYWILHKAMNLNFINTAISYTSLTKYAFWRRYHFPRARNSK